MGRRRSSVAPCPCELSPGDSSIKRHRALLAQMVGALRNRTLLQHRGQKHPACVFRCYALHHIYPQGIALLTATGVCFTPLSLVALSYCAEGRAAGRCAAGLPRAELHCAVAQAVHLVQGQVAVLTQLAWPMR